MPSSVEGGGLRVLTITLHCSRGAFPLRACILHPVSVIQEHSAGAISRRLRQHHRPVPFNLLPAISVVAVAGIAHDDVLVLQARAVHAL